MADENKNLITRIERLEGMLSSKLPKNVFKDGNHNFYGNITFNGSTTFIGETIESGDKVYSGNNTHNGINTFNSTINADGETNFNGNVNVNTYLSVLSESSFTGTTNISNANILNLTCVNDLTITSNPLINGNITSAGNNIFNGTNTFNNTNVYTGENNHQGEESFDGRLVSYSDADFYGNFTVGTLENPNLADFYSVTTFNNNVTNFGNLFNHGNITNYSTLTNQGTVNNQGISNFSGNSNFSSDVNFTNVPTHGLKNISTETKFLKYCENFNGIKLMEKSFSSNGNKYDRVRLSDDGTIFLLSQSEINSNAGSISVYELINGNWTQKGTTVTGTSGDYFGYHVGLSNDGLTFAASYNNSDKGGIKIYSFESLSWTLKKTISGNSIGDFFGYGISFGENTLITGEFRDNGLFGEIFVYEYVEDDWIPKGNTLEICKKMSGENVDISEDGSVIIIGSKNNNDNGFVEVYEFLENDWVKKGETLNGSLLETFGNNVSISSDGNTIAICAEKYNTDEGKIYFYTWDNSEWVERTALNNTFTENSIGLTCALSGDGDYVVVSDQLLNSSKGSIYVYYWDSVTWNEIARDISDAADNTFLGRNVCCSRNGKTIAATVYTNSFRIYNFGTKDTGLLNYKIENPVVGSIYFSKYNNSLNIYNGSEWLSMEFLLPGSI